MSFANRIKAAPRGRLFFCAAVLAIVLAWALWPRPRPSVLLITIDTLRADALAADDAPALLELAGRGRRFVRARTPVPLTLPAHVTILSGVDPPGHGVRDNTAHPLAEDRGFPLLAEEFRDAGYATAAFVASAVLDRRYRLDAGFTEYRQPPQSAPGAPVFADLTAEQQVERVRAWMSGRPKDRPFFVWVHLWEPHAPYAPYDGDERRAGTAATDGPRERYRGEVRRADAAVEAMLGLVDRERTVVVVTSDHGESFGAHGEDTHGFLCYGATMDVPLVLAGPGVAPGSEERLCALADVAPTLRGLCGLAARPGDGRDLLALPGARIVVGESLYAHRLYGWAQQSVATDGRYTLVDGGPRLEVFDRTADPGEERPLAEPERLPEYEALDKALAAYRRRRRAGEPVPSLTPAGSPYGAQRLAVNEFLPPAANRKLKDVAAFLPADRLLGRVRAAIAARSVPLVEQLLPQLAALEREDPSNPAPCLERGRALLLVMRRPAEAEQALEEAIRRGYDAPDMYRLLGRAYRASGNQAGLDRIRKHLPGG